MRLQSAENGKTRFTHLTKNWQTTSILPKTVEKTTRKKRYSRRKSCIEKGSRGSLEAQGGQRNQQKLAKHTVFYSFTTVPGNLTCKNQALAWTVCTDGEKRKKRVHEKALLTTEILPKTVGKATRKSATHDGNLELKKGPGELGGRPLPR